MTNLWRVAAFDIAAPLAAIAALLMIGLVLDWPAWWVSVCSVLVLLIVEGIAVNYFLLRRDSVTVGTDDDGPGLRLAVVTLCAAALVAAIVIGYIRWTLPDRDFKRDTAEVVSIATRMAEATATFSPQDPTGSLEKAAAMMVPERAVALKDQFAKTATDLARRNITAQAATLSAGVEGIGPTAASVAVILRADRSILDEPAKHAVLALRVMLTKNSGRWLVLDLSPINSR